MRKVVNFGCCYHAVENIDFRNSEFCGTTFALEELVEMFSDPMKLLFSYSHHFNWFYCLKNLQIFFSKSCTDRHFIFSCCCRIIVNINI